MYKLYNRMKVSTKANDAVIQSFAFALGFRKPSFKLLIPSISSPSSPSPSLSSEYSPSPKSSNDTLPSATLNRSYTLSTSNFPPFSFSLSSAVS